MNRFTSISQIALLVATTMFGSDASARPVQAEIVHGAAHPCKDVIYFNNSPRTWVVSGTYEYIGADGAHETREHIPVTVGAGQQQRIPAHAVNVNCHRPYNMRLINYRWN